MRKALFETATGLVVNIIVLEDGANWTPLEGCEVVDAETVGGVGDTWDGQHFVAASEPTPPHSWWQK